MTFFSIKSQMVVSISFQKLSQINPAIIKRLFKNKEIIDENFKTLLNQIKKYEYHTFLRGCRGIA